MPRKTQVTRVVNVTAEDIRDAEKEMSTTCMVARAIKREIVGSSHLLVDIQTIRFTMMDEGIRYVYLTPPEIQDYIVAFDAGDPIQPFTFKLQHVAYSHETHNYPHVTAHIGDKNGGINPKGDTIPYIEIPVSTDTIPSPGKASYKRSYGVRKMRVNQDRSK